MVKGTGNSLHTLWNPRAAGQVAGVLGCAVHGAGVHPPRPRPLCRGVRPSFPTEPPTCRSSSQWPGVCLISRLLPSIVIGESLRAVHKALSQRARWSWPGLRALAGMGASSLLHLRKLSPQEVWEGCQVGLASRRVSRASVSKMSEPLGHCFSTRDNSVPQGTSGNVWRQSWFSQLAGEGCGSTGIW
ncbi:hypothetical protein HJG60_007764 [Phyllostomus discolor]|uniref:Uncharacterized protein n=1 Tax=Phyllostomus discolor TaxID=89673 RepID=A0A834BN52_9CHIR|nr:hypothetical protein HJG60_007764 [Phyllostomus discolor]